MTQPERDKTAQEQDRVAQEQTRVRISALVGSAVAAVLAVVALGLSAWVWAAGLTALAIGCSLWAARMYADLADYRRQELSQRQLRMTYDDPYEGSDQ